MQSPFSIMVLATFLPMGLINPTYAFPIRSYKAPAVLESVVTVAGAFQAALDAHPENPLLGSFLHDPDFLRDLAIIEDALRSTTSDNDSTAFPPTTAIVGSALPGSPVVELRNLSPAPVCYYVELSSGKFERPSICDFSRDALPGQGSGIVVPPNCTTTVYTGADFNGAFTEIIGGNLDTIAGVPALVNGKRGARHEINYASFPHRVYYDISYEFGFSNSKLGPSSVFPFEDMPSSMPEFMAQNGGHNPVQGEENLLAKSNDAWSNLSLSDKSALAEHGSYLNISSNIGTEVGGSGFDMGTSWLSGVSHDKGAPALVKYFYQITAGVRAYVYHGSAPVEAGLTEDNLEALMRPVADMFSYSWEFSERVAKNMTVAAYPNWMP